MRGKPWNKEQDDFLYQKKAEGLSSKEVCLEFEKAFPGAHTYSSITTRMGKDLGLNDGKRPPKELIKPRANQYTPEEISYLKEISKGKTLKQVVIAFREKYPERTETSVRSYLKETMHFKSDKKALELQMKNNGRIFGFDKNHIPVNKTPIGTISVRTDKKGHKYKWIKVREGKPVQRNYEPLHRVVWELNKGPIPPGGIIMFKDGNAMNSSIDNLILCENERVRRYTQPYVGISKEIAEAGHALAMLKNAIVETENENGNRK